MTRRELPASGFEVGAGTVADAEVVRFVSDLMGFLRSRGHRVVAACGFEDELPQTDLV